MTLSDSPVAYSDEQTPLTGVLYRDESDRGQRPAILLIHGGAGLDEHAREQARRWASLGYVVFACDMYGDGVVGDRERVMARLKALVEDPALLVRRAQAGLDVLHHHTDTDGRLAVVGYCFGGLAALTMARVGTALEAVVSMHGSLKSPAPAEPDAIRARILVCHGASDPHVPAADVTAFVEEMERARADWQLIVYGGAMHGFTHRDVQPGAVPGVAFDERADRRSFEAATRFLAEVFTR